MKKYPVFLLLLCMSAGLKAQTDTVAAKINKIPYKKVDVPAKFGGGDFAKYIASNIDYAKRFDRNIHGQVIVAMKVDSTGKVSEVDVLKSMFADIDKEVVHVVKSSPRWSPAILNGKPVSVYMVFNVDMGIRGTPPPSIPPLPPANSPAVVSKPLSAPAKTKPPVNNRPLPLLKVPSPIVAIKPTLKAIKKAVPPFDKKPVAVVLKPIPSPIVAKKVVPPVVKKPIPPPVVAKKVTPPVVKKPVPPPPIVAKKVVPPVVKPVAPPPVVAKKVVPPVAKKSVQPSVVAKQVTPPVVATPVATPPVVAKKVTPPVVAKPVPPPPVVAKKVMPTVEKKPVAPIVAKVIPKKKPVVKPKVKTTPPEQDISSLGRSADAEFPNGGLNAFFRYLNQNIHYPVLSKVNRIEGVVTLTFVVDMEGTVSNVKVVSAPSDDLADEASRVLLASPKWRPAMQNGRVINRTFTVPIDFKLSDKKQ